MNELPELLKTLHFKYVEPKLADLMEEARLHSFTYEAFLRRVLALEAGERRQAAHETRRKGARLPVSKTLDAFDFSFQPSINERQLRELADLSFVRTHSNVVLLGPPGVGKTHLALSLAGKALDAGYSVFFSTLTDLEQASQQHALKGRLRRYITPQVLVIDEIGYTNLSALQANRLFDLVRERTVPPHRFRLHMLRFFSRPHDGTHSAHELFQHGLFMTIRLKDRLSSLTKIKEAGFRRSICSRCV